MIVLTGIVIGVALALAAQWFNAAGDRHRFMVLGLSVVGGFVGTFAVMVVNVLMRINK